MFVCFELFKIGENLGAVEPGCAQDFDRLRKIATRNEAAHRSLGNVTQQVGGFLEVNQSVLLGGRHSHWASGNCSCLVLELFEFLFVGDALHVHALGQFAVALENFCRQTALVLVDKFHQELLFLGVDVKLRHT